MSGSHTGQRFVTRFLRGTGCLFRALRLMARNRRVLVLSLVPFAICLLLYVGFFLAVVVLADDVADLVLQPGTWWRSVVRFLFIGAFDLVFLLVGIFTYSAACFVVAAPLYEFLSAATERSVTGAVKEEPFSMKNALVDVWRALVGTVTVLLMELVVLAASFLFVPVTTFLALLASAVLLSLEYLDYPMGRRRMRLREKLAFARRHAWEFMGLGLPMLAGLAVPFAGVVFLPVGVVGGTLLFVDLADGPQKNPD